MGIGGAILNYIGGTIRYFYGYMIREMKLTNRKSYSYREYLYGPDDAEDFVLDGLSHGFINKIVGMIGLFVICLILMKF